ncbi:MAG: hypothetical protein OHK0017_01080 [Patescibacteria group bacterium]
MNLNLPSKIMLIGNILKGGSLLLRKKFAGSPPYNETWYSFGVEFNPDQEPVTQFQKYIETFIGLNCRLNQVLPWSNEVKEDHDGVEKHFIYLQMLFEYLDGEPILPEGHEKIEFISLNNLSEIDLVPPTRENLIRIGLINN